VFVGLKMAWLNQLYGGKFPIQWSLAVIAGLIGLSVALSLLWPEPEPPRVAASPDPRGIGHSREF
jgi:tellurite resistance protein TerC